MLLTPPPPRSPDWEGMTRANAEAIAASMRVPAHSLTRLVAPMPAELRHAKHVRSPHPGCAVCQAKGRV
jgi:hypothetical protein